MSYKFIYGDGSDDTGTNPIQSHQYTAIGTYTATVVVTDSNGKSATTSVAITVS